MPCGGVRRGGRLIFCYGLFSVRVVPGASANHPPLGFCRVCVCGRAVSEWKQITSKSVNRLLMEVSFCVAMWLSVYICEKIVRNSVWSLWLQQRRWRRRNREVVENGLNNFFSLLPTSVWVWLSGFCKQKNNCTRSHQKATFVMRIAYRKALPSILFAFGQSARPWASGKFRLQQRCQTLLSLWAKMPLKIVAPVAA